MYIYNMFISIVLLNAEPYAHTELLIMKLVTYIGAQCIEFLSIRSLYHDVKSALPSGDREIFEQF